MLAIQWRREWTHWSIYSEKSREQRQREGSECGGGSTKRLAEFSQDAQLKRISISALRNATIRWIMHGFLTFTWYSDRQTLAWNVRALKADKILLNHQKFCSGVCSDQSEPNTTYRSRCHRSLCPPIRGGLKEGQTTTESCHAGFKTHRSSLGRGWCGYRCVSSTNVPFDESLGAGSSKIFKINVSLIWLLSLLNAGLFGFFFLH